MNDDDSGTHKFKLEDLKNPPKPPEDGFSKDEIDTLADLISVDEKKKAPVDLDDTGSFKR